MPIATQLSPEDEIELLEEKVSQLQNDLKNWQNTAQLLQEECDRRRASYAELHQSHARLLAAYYAIRLKEKAD